MAAYVLLDWVSYVEPLFGLNITPWNPEFALGLLLWLKIGRRAALPWFVALELSEHLVRGLPAGPIVSAASAVLLVTGYGIVSELLRRALRSSREYGNRQMTFWLVLVVIALTLNGLAYVGLLTVAGLIPVEALADSTTRYVIGDVIGFVMTMPLLWILSSPAGRRNLMAALGNWETAGYLSLAGVLIGCMFAGWIGTGKFRHFYFLFLPIIWAAARQGVNATALIVFVIQVGITSAFRLGRIDVIPFSELQLFGAVLAIVGIFIGLTVDEQRKTANELKNSLRLAAAGEMAAALAHELNQPITALSAYGRACEHLLAHGDNPALLPDVMRKMVLEAGRVSEVVIRLREFFRTGTMQLEATDIAVIVDGVVAQFAAQCETSCVRLSVAVVPGIRIRVDRLQIELVLRNLVANAVDAVMARPPEHREIMITAVRLAGARLQVTVEDSGPGITAKAISQLFEPFVSGKSNGLGLGLALSRSIVEAHGGSIWAETGERGLLRFVLPLVDHGSEHVK
ncbi:hypothetical protein AYR66_20750 [Noviherbaspirillum denitrificans]|uniref:histidine kinase n=1 Tax=Noviherbaspirillum denitrificans TaxID=1968433 RepID=A0A254TK37_9BURK|nr:hypothetical protein AYR66_20750 [Noviherbaspirillum denitrificans]